jgi:hypothetical protein
VLMLSGILLRFKETGETPRLSPVFPVFHFRKEWDTHGVARDRRMTQGVHWPFTPLTVERRKGRMKAAFGPWLLAFSYSPKNKT